MFFLYTINYLIQTRRPVRISNYATPNFFSRNKSFLFFSLFIIKILLQENDIRNAAYMQQTTFSSRPINAKSDQPGQPDLFLGLW